MTHQNIDVLGEGEVIVGSRTSIQPNVQIIFHRPATVRIGDYCTLGQGVKIICDGGGVSLGDWTSLHDRCLVLSSVGVHVGEHGWFGQHTVLDGTGGLKIGHGVRVGMYSQVWSHVAAGEQIEGCTLFGTRSVTIEDDVWLVGSCIVASGVTLGRRTIALIASNITKSWPENSVLAGSPASRKEALSFYKKIDLDEQWNLLATWLAEAAATIQIDRVEARAGYVYRWLDGRTADTVAFIRHAHDLAGILDEFPGATVCCLGNKKYLKRLTDLEHRILKHLSSNKARFKNWVDDEVSLAH